MNKNWQRRFIERNPIIWGVIVYIGDFIAFCCKVYVALAIFRLLEVLW